MIAKTRAEFPFHEKFPRNASHKITISRNLAGFSFLVALQITGHTDFLWKHFVKTLMWGHTMKKIPLCCKFNVFFIWLKIAPVSAWDFKFEMSCFLCLKTFEVVLSGFFIEHSLWRSFTDLYIYNVLFHINSSCEHISGFPFIVSKNSEVFFQYVIFATRILENCAIKVN